MTNETTTDIPHRLIHMLDETWAAISDLIAELDEPTWKQPSELPGWTVQDIVAHLIGTEIIFLGRPSAPARTVESPHVRNPLGDMIENEVEARRSLTGAEVRAEWEEVRAARLQQLAEGDAAYFAQDSFTPAGPGTIADFMVFRVLDCWIHEQDLRRVLGRPGNLGNASANHTIDRLLITVPMVVAKRARVPDGQAVRVRIVPDPVTGDGLERDVVCEVSGTRAAYVDEPSADPITTITFTTEAFLMLATGRRPVAEVRATDGAVTIAGDATYGDAIVNQFTMMI